MFRCVTLGIRGRAAFHAPPAGASTADRHHSRPAAVASVAAASRHAPIAASRPSTPIRLASSGPALAEGGGGNEDDIGASGGGSYVHPLSEQVIARLGETAPDWVTAAALRIRPDGTAWGEAPPQAESAAPGGGDGDPVAASRVEWSMDYAPEMRAHVMTVRIPGTDFAASSVLLDLADDPWRDKDLDTLGSRVDALVADAREALGGEANGSG